MRTRALLTANTISGYTPRHEEMGGRRYVVAPAVILVEGVHRGTAGPVFYPSEEMRTSPGAWNGRPVTLGHPEIDGEPVSASTPEALEQFNLGTLFNTRFDEEIIGLRSEVWIDEIRARRLAPEVLEAVLRGDPMEISTGLWFKPSGGVGIWRNEDFDVTATDFRPDHLALLPEDTGACSNDDGCGLRVNKGSTEQEENMEKGFWDFVKGCVKNHEGSKQEQVAVLIEKFATNQPGMRTTVEALQRQLDAMDRDVPNGSLIHWLEDAFADGTFVMRQVGPEGMKFFRGAFTASEEDGVDINEEEGFTEVREKREFIETTNTDSGQDDTPIEEEEGVGKTKEEAVSALIGCDKTPFTENHREGLMTMDEVALEGLKAKEEVSSAAASPQGNEDTPKTLKEFVDAAPDGLKGSLNDALTHIENSKKEVIGNILLAPGNTFTAEALAVKNLAELSALEALVKGKPETEEKPEGNVEQQPVGNWTGQPAVNTAPVENAEGGAAPLGRAMVDDFASKN